MAYRVVITRQAQNDILDIGDYIAEHDCPENADYVVDQIEQVIRSLDHLPERGVVPRELSDIRNYKYREHFFKPYRIFYQIRMDTVFVELVADGRRDIKALLDRRQLGQ